MKPCKRIEIVIAQGLTRRTTDLLEELGVPNYTLISGVSGRGDRGRRRADDPTGSDTNSVFIIACEDTAQAEQIVEGMRSLLEISGGVCLLSDASWMHY